MSPGSMARKASFRSLTPDSPLLALRDEGEFFRERFASRSQSDQRGKPPLRPPLRRTRSSMRVRQLGPTLPNTGNRIGFPLEKLPLRTKLPTLRGGRYRGEMEGVGQEAIRR